MNLLCFVECKRARATKKKKQQADHGTAVIFILVLFSLTFVPLIIYFFYNVLKDPITPSLVKNAGEMIKEKTMGYLSRKKKELNDGNKQL